MALSTLPSADVTVTIASNNPDVTLAPTTSLTFTTANWETPQSITVTAAEDDDLVQDDATLAHTIASTDADYANLTTDLAVTVPDNDIPGLTLTPASLTLDEGTTTPYTAVLDTLPTADVTVAITSDNPDVTPAPTTLTFTTANWETPQSITVTAAEDADLVQDDATLTHTIASTDIAYDGTITADLAVTVTDNDTPPMFAASVTIDGLSYPNDQDIVLALPVAPRPRP